MFSLLKHTAVIFIVFAWIAIASKNDLNESARRLQQAARIVNSIYLQQGFQEGLIPESEFISEILQFGSVKPSQLGQMDVDQLRIDMEVFKGLPDQANGKDLKLEVEVEKIFSDIENVLKQFENIEEVGIWSGKDDFEKDVKDLVNGGGDLGPIQNITRLEKGFSYNYEQLIRFKDASDFSGEPMIYLKNLKLFSQNLLDLSKEAATASPEVFKFKGSESGQDALKPLTDMDTAFNLLDAHPFNSLTDNQKDETKGILDALFTSNPSIQRASSTLEPLLRILNSRRSTSFQLQYTAGLPNGYDDIEKVFGDLNEMWIKNALGPNKFSTQLEPLKSFGEPARNVKSKMSGDLEKTRSSLIRIIKRAKTFQYFFSDKSLIEKTIEDLDSCVSQRRGNYQTAKVIDNLINSIKEVDAEIENVKNTSSDIQKGISDKKFQDVMTQIISIHKEAEHQTGDELKATFKKFYDIPNLDDAVNKLTKYRDELTVKQNALNTASRKVQNHLPAIQTFLTATVGFKQSLDCFRQIKDRQKGFDAVKRIGELRKLKGQSKFVSEINGAVEFAETVKRTVPDLKKIEGEVKRLRGVQSPEQEALAMFKDSKKHSGVIGMASRGVMSIQKALDDRSTVEVLKQSDIDLVNHLKAKARKVRSGDDVVNKMATLKDEIPRMYSSLTTFEGNTKDPKNVTKFEQLVDTIPGTEKIVGISVDTWQMVESLETLVDGLEDPSEKASCSKVKNAIDVISSYGLEFHRYQSDFSSLKTSLATFDLFLVNYEKKMNPPTATADPQQSQRSWSVTASMKATSTIQTETTTSQPWYTSWPLYVGIVIFLVLMMVLGYVFRKTIFGWFGRKEPKKKDQGKSKDGRKKDKPKVDSTITEDPKAKKKKEEKEEEVKPVVEEAKGKEKVASSSSQEPVPEEKPKVEKEEKEEEPKEKKKETEAPKAVETNKVVPGTVGEAEFRLSREGALMIVENLVNSIDKANRQQWTMIPAAKANNDDFNSAVFFTEFSNVVPVSGTALFPLERDIPNYSMIDPLISGTRVCMNALIYRCTGQYVHANVVKCSDDRTFIICRPPQRTKERVPIPEGQEEAGLTHQASTTYKTWAMIDQKDVSSVVMMGGVVDTKDAESYEECGRYFPDEAGGLWSETTVNVECLSKKALFNGEVIHRRLKYTFVKTSINVSREIDHYQFINWTVDPPPQSSDAVIKILQLIDSSSKIKNSVLVHGQLRSRRSGAFVLAYMIYKEMMTKARFNLRDVIQKLRNQRAAAADDPQQIAFAIVTAIRWLMEKTQEFGPMTSAPYQRLNRMYERLPESMKKVDALQKQYANAPVPKVVKATASEEQSATEEPPKEPGPSGEAPPPPPPPPPERETGEPPREPPEIPGGPKKGRSLEVTIMGTLAEIPCHTRFINLKPIFSDFCQVTGQIAVFAQHGATRQLDVYTYDVMEYDLKPSACRCETCGILETFQKHVTSAISVRRILRMCYEFQDVQYGYFFRATGGKRIFLLSVEAQEDNNNDLALMNIFCDRLGSIGKYSCEPTIKYFQLDHAFDVKLGALNKSVGRTHKEDIYLCYHLHCPTFNETMFFCKTKKNGASPEKYLFNTTLHRLETVSCQCCEYSESLLIDVDKIMIPLGPSRTINQGLTLFTGKDGEVRSRISESTRVQRRTTKDLRDLSAQEYLLVRRIQLEIFAGKRALYCHGDHFTEKFVIKIGGSHRLIYSNGDVRSTAGALAQAREEQEQMIRRKREFGLGYLGYRDREQLRSDIRRFLITLFNMLSYLRPIRRVQGHANPEDSENSRILFEYSNIPEARPEDVPSTSEDPTDIPSTSEDVKKEDPEDVEEME